MFQTALTERLGIQYPIVGGTMMSISTADFVAAISEAGGLGILASAIYQSREEFAIAVDRIQELTDRPFAVNINLFPSMRPINNNDYLDVLIDKGVKIVETSGHSAPVDLCKRFKDAGMTWIHKCVGIRYALKVESMGADMVTVVGYENGGATGKLDIGTLVLIPAVKDAVGIPVIGGGGVADGRGVAAVLSLGADGVIMGTRFLLTKECPIHDNLKQALLNASELDTMLIMRSIDATHRVWRNTAAQKCADKEASGADLMEILPIVAGDQARKMYREGDLDAGVISVGQGVGLIHDIPTVKELMEQIMAQAKETVMRLTA
ncbi:MAG: nitronate monooxygenase [Desulfobacteraceae bacterium]|nr:MAG: nitronate monooxygenase [Desulfobacteraceae bacterium]